MKINNRYYLDFNASSPLASSVKEYFVKGDFFYGNPSSVHTSGKKSRRAIREVEHYLRETYSVSDSYLTFFHSGATEGLNIVLQGAAKNYFRRQEKVQFLLGQADHSCIVNQADDLIDYGHIVSFFSPEKDGSYDKASLIKKIQEYKGKTILNFTWVNNETGVCNPLSLAEEIKQETGCYVVVDAVQSVGKIIDWNKISNKLDAYTFSGHKFGAMKGVGWTFMHVNYPFAPLLRGGGQQGGLRSGTENTDGVHSLMLALEELQQKQSKQPIQKFMKNFEGDLVLALGEKGHLVAEESVHRCLSTFYIILNTQKADTTLIAFDLDRIDVSSGSACSSGALEPSRVLLSMGYDEPQAKSALRISFPFAFDEAEYMEMKNTVFKVLNRILS